MSAFAQLDISQKGDNIIISNLSNNSTEILILNSDIDNFILMPNQSTSVTPKSFLTKKALKEIKILSLYTYSSYLADHKISVYKMREEIIKYRGRRKNSLQLKSIEDLLNSPKDTFGKFDKLDEEIDLEASFDEKNKYKLFIKKIEQKLIPLKDEKNFLIDNRIAFENKVNETEESLAKSYLFDFLNIEIDPEDQKEINFLISHYNRVKSIKEKYENRSINNHGSLRELDFKIFETKGSFLQFSIIGSAIGEDIGGENEEVIFNINPEISIRVGRYRLGHNTMIENNINLGYSYYVAEKIDEKIVINDIVNNIDEVYDKFHLGTLGLDFILKGGVKKPSLFGFGIEGGGTYLISDTYNFMPDLDLSEYTETDLGYYYGGFLMIGDRFNVKIGFRRYVLRYTIETVDRNYLNTGLTRFSLSYRF